MVAASVQPMSFTFEQGREVEAKLLDQRVIMLGGVIDDDRANDVVAKLLHLDADGSGKDISLYINSPGGSATAGLAVYDAMQATRAEVATYCFGMAASAAAVVLTGGAAGKRHALHNARVLIHQPHGSTEGNAADIQIQAQEFAFIRRRLEEIIAAHTGQPTDRVRADSDRDFILGAEEARDYGLIDRVVPMRRSLEVVGA